MTETTTPPGKPVTTEEQEAARAELEAIMAAERGPDVPDPLEGTAEPAEPAEEVDVAALAADLVKSGPTPVDQWRGEAKAKLIEAGWNEKTAHQMAYNDSPENVRKLLDGDAGAVQSGQSQPAVAPTGAEDVGSMLAEALGLEDSEAKDKIGQVIETLQASARNAADAEIAALKEQIGVLSERTMAGDVQAKQAEIVQAREALESDYPELRSRAQWDRVTPLVKVLMQSDEVSSVAEALKAACVTKFGVRSGEAAIATTDPAPSPTQSGQATPGAAGADAAATAKKKVTQMIFDGRTEADVLGYRAKVERQLGVSPG